MADAMMDNGCEDSHWMHGVLCLGKACFFSQWIKESVSDKTRSKDSLLLFVS